MISEADIDGLKRAVAQAREGEQPEHPAIYKELLAAAEKLLLKGGWSDPAVPEAAPPKPVSQGSLANELPAGMVLEGYELAPDQPGRKKAVNRPAKQDAKEDSNQKDDGENASAQKETVQLPDWSGDNVVLPIELMGVLHDSLVELADAEPSNEDGPGREALMSLIDHMEDILEQVGQSEELTRFLDREK